MKKYENVVFRRPACEGILPVWNENCKILMLGSITAVDGMNKGFYYASSRNQLWELLDYSLNTDSFMKLKNELKDNYELFKNNKITNDEFIANRLNIKNQFSETLLNNNIAVCDVFTECYFNNNSSMDVDIILNNKEYPYKTSKEIIQNIIDKSKIKLVVVNSKFVETMFYKMNIKGDFEVKYVISPSPRRGTIEKKKESWKDVFNIVSKIDK